MSFKFLIITIFTGSAAITVSCGYSGGSYGGGINGRSSYNGGYNNVRSYSKNYGGSSNGGVNNGGVPSENNNNIIGN